MTTASHQRPKTHLRRRARPGHGAGELEHVAPLREEPSPLGLAHFADLREAIRITRQNREPANDARTVRVGNDNADLAARPGVPHGSVAEAFRCRETRDGELVRRSHQFHTRIRARCSGTDHQLHATHKPDRLGSDPERAPTAIVRIMSHRDGLRLPVVAVAELHVANTSDDVPMLRVRERCRVGGTTTRHAHDRDCGDDDDAPFP